VNARLLAPLVALLVGCATTPSPRRSVQPDGLDPQVLALFVQAQTVLHQPTTSPAMRAEQAAGLLRAAIAMSPQSASLWRFLAEAWSQMPDHGAAIAAASRAVELDPLDARAWHLLGQAQYRLQEHDSAVANLRQAVALGVPGDESYLPHYYLQAALRELGRTDEAVDALDAWAKALPADTNPRSMQAKLLWDLGRADEAAAAALEAIGQDRSNLEVLRIFVHIHRLDPSAAAEHLAEIVRTAWSASSLHRQLVDLYEQIGRYDDALSHLETVVTLEPSAADELAPRRVALLIASHRYDDAVARAEAVLDGAPDPLDEAHAAWVLQLAEARRGLGQDASARAALELLLPGGPRAEAAALQLADLVAQDRPGDALTTLQPFLLPALDPSEALLRAAVRHGVAGRRFEDADRHIEQVARRSPREAILLRAELLQARGELDGAIRLLATSSADHPEDMWMASRLADLLVAADRADAARGVLTASLGAVRDRTAGRVERAAGAVRFEAEQDGISDQVWLLLRRSWAERRDDDPAASEATLREALALQPAHPDVLNGLGYLLAELGTEAQLPEAEALLLRATAQQPFSAAYADSLGVVYLRQGRHEDALRLLESSVAWLPDSAEVLEHLADAYRAAGDSVRAGATYRRIVEMGPSLPDHERVIVPRAEDKLRTLESTASD